MANAMDTFHFGEIFEKWHTITFHPFPFLKPSPKIYKKKMYEREKKNPKVFFNTFVVTIFH